VNDLVGGWAAQRTVDEAVTALKEADLPVAPVRSYAAAAQDPHIRERDMLQSTSLDGGPEIPVVGPAAKLSRTPTRVRSGPPALGAHTDAILEELGYDTEARRHLRDRGAI
jgi:formyl-CoA transferase